MFTFFSQIWLRFHWLSYYLLSAYWFGRFQAQRLKKKHFAILTLWYPVLWYFEWDKPRSLIICVKSFLVVYDCRRLSLKLWLPLYFAQRRSVLEWFICDCNVPSLYIKSCLLRRKSSRRGAFSGGKPIIGLCHCVARSHSPKYCRRLSLYLIGAQWFIPPLPFLV